MIKHLAYALTGSLLVVSLTACNEPEPDAEPPLRPVRYVTVEDGVTGKVRTFSGVSKSTQESRLSFKVLGNVIELPAQVGDSLKAGDLIARLDASQYELQAQQSQATLVEVRANARNAQSNYERVKGLYENSNASRNDLDSARAASESARAQERAAQKALELASLSVDYTRLTVDTDCSVASIDVDLNENVSAGTQIAKVTCGNELEVDIDVPESLIASIKQNMTAAIRFDAVSGRTFTGKVTEVGIESGSSTATFPVTVRVMESDGGLRSGLAAEVSFSFQSQNNGDIHLLPLAAIINDQNGAFVYLAQSSGGQGEAVIARKAVKLGELTEAGMEVLGGLKHGDRVVTAGVSVIRDGQKVLAQ